MFIGHTAVALGAKPLAPRASFGLLLAAAMWLDLVWPVFVLLGIERVRVDPGNTALTPLDFEWYPWTHSLLTATGWGVLFAAVAFLALRRGSGGSPQGNTWRAAVILGALVLSHWVLDAVTHRPDLPLWPGSASEVGLGLWNSVLATIVIETLLFAAGVAIYLRSTRRRDRVGHWALWAFVSFSYVIYLANIFGPPPPSAQAVGWGALAGWLLPLWAWWIDRHREAVRS